MKNIFIFSFIAILCGCSKEKSPDLNLKKELAEIEFRDQFVREISATTPNDSIELFAKKLNVNPVYFKNNYKSFAVISDGQNLRRIE